eukprot:7457655-Alexandrium_andersonii.AAC.1
MAGIPDSLSAMLLTYREAAGIMGAPRPGGGEPRAEGGARFSPRPGKGQRLASQGGGDDQPIRILNQSGYG